MALSPNGKTIVSLQAARAAGLTRYFTGKSCKYGHVCERAVVNSTCIECQYAGVRRWAKNNPDYLRDKGRERARKYRKDPAVRKKHNGGTQKWRSRPENKLREKATGREYKKNNKDKMRAKENRRRARVLGNGGEHTPAQISELFIKQDKKCANPFCKKDISAKYHVDHILPIVLGGSNFIFNIQLLCPGCNHSKGPKHPDQWRRELMYKAYI